MNADPSTAGTQAGGGYPVDARGATGVQVGEGNTQIIYTYNRLTWTDGIAPSPLADISGVIESPYRGLSAFEERDAALFFGREAAATQVLERMSRQLDRIRLLVMSGVSGAGKSSLLRAGVLPRIRGAGLVSAPESARWPCLVFSPGRAPLDELAVRAGSLAGADAAAVRRSLDADPASFPLTMRQAALTQAARLADLPGGSAPGRPGLLLVVDQFEQLFTQCPDEQQRQSFITALHAATTADERADGTPVLVVLVVRADFEARCADYPQLADAVQDRYLVTAMTERQLRMAITEPAKKAGSRVDADLAEVLLREVRTRHPAVSGGGVLPLLSHALDQAWRSRSGDVLALADYERAGGIEGAVAESAQRAYRRLTAAQQATARQVFIRLTATSSDGADTADRASRAELTQGKSAAEIQDVEAVLEAFAAERLVTLAAGTVEISHEILLTAWPLLREVWLAETHADRIVRTRLRNAAGEWERDSGDSSYLYSGSLLATADEAAARISADPARHPPLSAAERSFLHASRGARRRRARRRRSLIAFFAALAVGLASITVLAVRASREAVHQRDAASAGQLMTNSAALGDTDPAVSKLESIAAWQISPSAGSRYAMLAAAARPGIALLPGQGPPADSVAFSPDGKILAVTTDAPNVGTGFDLLVPSAVRLWDVTTHRQIGRALTGFEGVDTVAFSPDGTKLATGDYRAVRLWDVASHRQIGPTMTVPGGTITSVAFSPDGTILASGGEGGVRLWSVATHRPLGSALAGQVGHVTTVAFKPDGKILASGDSHGMVQLWGVTSHRPLGRPLTGRTSSVTSLMFMLDGRALIGGASDGSMQLWPVSSNGQAGKVITYNRGSARSVTVSRDGQTMITGGADGSVRFWDLFGEQIRGALTAQAGAVDSLSVSPDGKTLASGSDDGSVRLWDLTVGRPVGNPLPGEFSGYGHSVDSVAISPDGKTVAAGGTDGSIRLWGLPALRPLGPPLLGHTGTVTSVSFGPDGKTLASGGSDRTVRLWDITSHRQLGPPLTGQEAEVTSVAFSPGGQFLASGSQDGTARLWSVATHRPLGHPLGGNGSGNVTSVAFSPDRATLAVASIDGAARLWNVTTGKQIGGPLLGQRLAGHIGAVTSVAFSPDGHILAGGSTHGMVQLWDVAAHRLTGALSIGDPLTQTIEITSVAFSPDSKTVVSGGNDDNARLWDVATHRQIGDPLGVGPQAAIGTSVAFSPDGKTIITGGDSVLLWDAAFLVDTESQLCARIGRSFTHDDWARYVPQGPAYRDLCQ